MIDPRGQILHVGTKGSVTFDAPEAVKSFDGIVHYYSWRCPSGHASFNAAANLSKVVRPECVQCDDLGGRPPSWDHKQGRLATESKR